MKHTFTILLILSLMMIACADDPDQKGRTYKSSNDLVGAQQKIGFVRLGRFGNHWPAEIVEVKKSLDEIKFSLESEAKHTYPGYYDYELKMIRLKSADDSETVVVFRSKEIK